MRLVSKPMFSWCRLTLPTFSANLSWLSFTKFWTPLDLTAAGLEPSRHNERRNVLIKVDIFRDIFTCFLQHASKSNSKYQHNATTCTLKSYINRNYTVLACQYWSLEKKRKRTEVEMKGRPRAGSLRQTLAQTSSYAKKRKKKNKNTVHSNMECKREMLLKYIGRWLWFLIGFLFSSVSAQL